MRDAYKDSPHFERTAHFIAAYDNVAFDYDKPDLSLDLFEPMVRRVFSKIQRSVYIPTKST